MLDAIPDESQFQTSQDLEAALWSNAGWISTRFTA